MMKEYLQRQFRSYADLFVRKAGRLAEEEHDLLTCVSIPESWLREADRINPGYRIKCLKEQGRIAAKADGVVAPSEAECLKYGMFRAVREERPDPREDLELKAEELVRDALFADFEAEPEEIREVVEERLNTAIQDHLEDSNEEFSAWFWGSHNTLLKQLARGKRKSGGQLEIEQVRRVLLTLGWESHDRVDLGGDPPRPPTDPDVRISRIRFLISCFRYQCDPRSLR